jgi:hypothetical protein
MAESEHVIVRGVMVAVAVLVAPALGLATVGREEEQECDREKEKGRERQIIRDPSTGARLTGSLLSAAGAR